MKETRVTFQSVALTLEGLLSEAAAAPSGTAVVCHPHPQYGGSMHNNVVEEILDALWARGSSTLRFNFRGVGNSAGDYGGGEGEVQDAIAAVEYIRSKAATGSNGTLLAGYSFGALVGLRAGCGSSSVGMIAAVAAPTGLSDMSFVAECEKPTILISGDRDS